MAYKVGRGNQPLSLESQLLYWEKVLAVQNCHQEHYEEGLTLKYMHRKFIKSVFYISYNTYRAYLGKPAKKRVKEIKEKLDQKIKSKYINTDAEDDD